MNSKKFLPAAIAGAITYFIIGGLIYGKLLNSYIKSNEGAVTGFDRTDMLFWSIGIGSLFYGLLISYIFVRIANISSVSAGITVGGVIGFLLCGSFDFVFYGTNNMFGNLNVVAVDIAAYTVLSAIVGAAVGGVAGMGKKAA